MSSAEVQNLIRVLLAMHGTLVSVSVAVFSFVMNAWDERRKIFSNELSISPPNNVEAFMVLEDKLTKAIMPMKAGRALLLIIPLFPVALIYLYVNQIWENTTIVTVSAGSFVFIVWVIVLILIWGSETWKSS